MGESLGEVGLARSRWTEHQDIGFLKLDVGVSQVGPDALVVIVNRHAEGLLGQFLAYDVLLELLVDELGVQALVQEPVLGALVSLGRPFFRDDLVAQSDALIAYIHAIYSGYQAFDLIFRLTTERTLVLVSPRSHECGPPR